MEVYSWENPRKTLGKWDLASGKHAKIELENHHFVAGKINYQEELYPIVG
jgi:hypothetical protein